MIFALSGEDLIWSHKSISTVRCIIVPGSSTNVVYRADDRNDEHDDMMH